MGADTVPAQEARQRLYDIMRDDVPFDEKAHDALDLGMQYLGVDNGHLTRIDQETDHWEATVSTDAVDGPFPPGLELDLGTTYCRRAITADTPIALYDAPNQGWADDPAFDTHGLHCYLGTTLLLDGKPYGTVCFVSEDPRSEQFSDGEIMFAELITRLLERELEREQHEAELTRQMNLATVLNRVLRHNLRNDMSVIRGFTQLMADQLEEESYGETALENIDKLLDLSQKARELDRVIAADLERELTDIGALVADILGTVDDEYPAASLSLECEAEITATVLPSFERAIEELVENAAKHSGKSPTVTVTINTIPNAVEIHIVDDGPGLADHEVDVLKTGTETQLTHGSGLGLWLAHWIVTSHDGSITATSTENGTQMTVTVPRKPATNTQQELTKLARSRDRYEAAFEEASDAMVIINDDARIVETNSEAATIYGLDRQKLLGRSLLEFLPDELDFETEWQSFQDAGAKRDAVTVVGADGVERLVEYAATTDVVPGQHLVVSRDITEKMASKLQLETIIDNLPGYVYRHRYESGWPLEFVKGSAETVTGYTATELEEDITLAEDIIHPEDRDIVRTAVEDGLETSGRFDVTYRIITKDGAERWIRDRGQLVENPANGRECLDGFVTDVTESKEREQELHSLTQQLEALNHTAGELMTAEARTAVAEIGVAAAQDVLGLEANAIHLYDEDVDGLVPVSLTNTARQLIGEPPVLADGSIAWRVYETGEATIIDDVREDPDVHNPETAIRSELYLPLGEHGVLLAGSSTASAFTQDLATMGELLASTVATAMDQVEREQELRTREEELASQKEQLEEFASIVSHDLRNPLSVAQGYLEIADEQYDGSELTRVAQAHDRMQTLITDLLTLARQGNQVSDLEPVDLASLSDQCWRNVETDAATLTVDTTRTIQADRSRLQQLLENLMRNAVEHGGEDMSIRLGEIPTGFYIEDDGPGIPEAERENVFEMGYSTSEEGSGIGLNIVEEIVDAHEWTLCITESESGGARFEITGVEILDP